jgi:Fic family protein
VDFMLSYTLDKSIINRLRDLDNQIWSEYSQIQTLDEEELSYIHRCARISSIGASTRIENAQLSDAEVLWLDTILTQDGKPTALDEQRSLIEDKLSKDRERSIEEVTGCRNMMMLIYQDPQNFIPLREYDIRALHHELLAPYRNAGPFVGRYKKNTNSVVLTNHQTNQKKVIFQAADPGSITETAMHELVNWYNEAIKIEPWSIAAVAEFIYRFLTIHPFQDGNGRLGRGLFLLALLQSPNKGLAGIAPYLSIDRNIEKHKEEYYFVLNRCSKGRFLADPKQYRIGYFLDYMLKIIEKSIEDVHVYREKYHAMRTLSETASKVLACFREHPEIRLSSGDVTKMLNFPQRTIIYALNQLIEKKLIQKYGEGRAVRYQICF